MRMLGLLRTALLARTVTAAGLAAVYRYRDATHIDALARIFAQPR
jgi:hypothetical protein